LYTGSLIFSRGKIVKKNGQFRKFYITASVILLSALNAEGRTSFFNTTGTGSGLQSRNTEKSPGEEQIGTSGGTEGRQGTPSNSGTAGTAGTAGTGATSSTLERPADTRSQDTGAAASAQPPRADEPMRTKAKKSAHKAHKSSDDAKASAEKAKKAAEEAANPAKQR
jgi:hypothetical protein